MIRKEEVTSTVGNEPWNGAKSTSISLDVLLLIKQKPSPTSNQDVEITDPTHSHHLNFQSHSVHINISGMSFSVSEGGKKINQAPICI